MFALWKSWGQDLRQVVLVYCNFNYYQNVIYLSLKLWRRTHLVSRTFLFILVWWSWWVLLKLYEYMIRNKIIFFFRPWQVNYCSSVGRALSLHCRHNLTLVSNLYKQCQDPCFVPLTDSMNWNQKCTSNFLSYWLANQQWLFLTGQSWCVLESWYTGGGPGQGFWRCFADRLNKSSVSSVIQAIQ